MEWYYSIARDARMNRRPWQKPLGHLFGVLRAICWHLNQWTFRLFLTVAMIDDILTHNLDG